jgi:sulfoacetaldehyde dehydrogenase
MAVRLITPEEKACAAELLERARTAQKQVENYDQARVDRLCQAIGWATAN